MGTMELKAELIGIIESIEDNKVLDAIHVILTKLFKVTEKVDFWDELPDEIRNDIDEAIEEWKRGEGIPHKEAMKLIREKLAAL